MDGLVWLRRDLRLHDHAALSRATAECERVAVCFVFDRTLLDALADRDDRRVSFIHDSLTEVAAELANRGSRLIVLHGDPVAEIPRWASRLGVHKVYTNRDYEPAAKVRDDRVLNELQALGIGFDLSKDHVILESQEVRSQAGDPLRVFTPYQRAWYAAFRESDVEEKQVRQDRYWPANALPEISVPSLEEIGFRYQAPWLAGGRMAALQQLNGFRGKVSRYGEKRDFPAAEGTSCLSVHLRHGTLSTREVFRMSYEDSSAGHHKWRSELIWREFYQMILDAFPHVVDRAFKPEYDQVAWGDDPANFEAWRSGQTGYPIVDAAMRCFLATGWMHNRLRMVVASFLTKDLLLDWRLGEAHFARFLLDFDLAQNNGGWQWSASTGCDSQPYFRIFNPILQSRKFDAEGEFIREWVPELKGLSPEQIHWPHDLFGVPGYAPPIVDHSVQRDRAIRMFEAAKANDSRQIPENSR